MSDIYCRKCGEPWDSYGITHSIGDGDMTEAEAKRFRRGEGCPSCDFGSICTTCRGTGKDKTQCSTCYNSGYVIVHKLKSQPHEVYTLLRDKETITITNPTILKMWPNEWCLDGWYNTFKITCPVCAKDAPPCPACKGSGKFTEILTDEQKFENFVGLVEESDDPDSLLYE